MTPSKCAEACVTLAAEAYGVTRDDILLTRRRRRHVHARWVAMVAARELTGWSYPDLGELFGRDHTSIMYATRRVDDDEVLRAAADDVKLAVLREFAPVSEATE